MPLPTTFTGWSSLSMMASPHLEQTRLVRWLISSRFASEARAVFESSPFLGIDSRPLAPIFLLVLCVSGLFCGIGVPGQWETQFIAFLLSQLQYTTVRWTCPIWRIWDSGFLFFCWYVKTGSQEIDSLKMRYLLQIRPTDYGLQELSLIHI